LVLGIWSFPTKSDVPLLGPTPTPLTDGAAALRITTLATPAKEVLHLRRTADAINQCLLHSSAIESMRICLLNSSFCLLTLHPLPLTTFD
jgi:hypothetical protein